MLWLDTETFGTLDLLKVGSYRYAYHEDMEVLLFPYAFDDGDPQLVDVDGRPLRQALEQDAPELLARLESPEICVFHNSNFDRHILAASDIVIPVERIEDTMVQAYTLGYPGKLERLGTVLGLPEEMTKHAEGKKLINRFCKPAPKSHKADRYDRYSHPDEWDRFCEYAKQDIVAMRECHRRMPRVNLTTTERKVWYLDQKINDRGVRVDMKLVRAAVELAQDRQREVTDEIQHCTWGAVDKHTKSTAILEFCREAGVKMPNLQKETVEAMLKVGGMPEDVTRLLQLRVEANKATVSKYTAIGARVSNDGRLRGGFQYGGAVRTLRWAGRGAQLHNLARPPWWLDQAMAAEAVLGGYVGLLYPDPLDIVKGIVRGSFIPARGKRFAVSDLSNIEGRLTAWVCDETWKIKAFDDFDHGIGPDIYKKTYAESFGIPVEDVDKDGRQIGKVQELAGGYQGWIGAWETFANTYGLPPFPEEEICEIMGNWRDAHPRTRSMWGMLEKVWRHAIKHPGQGWTCGKHLTMRYYPKHDMLLVRIPSGRFVVYLNPKSGDQLGYMGQNDRGMWVFVDTYGGKLLENLVQAIARDVLAWAMLSLDALGYDLVMHVHDEVVAEVDASIADDALSHINEVLATVPEWAPGLPLAAAGFTADRYRKD